MQNILFIVNDSTYSGEKTFNAVRFAINMKEEHSKDVNIKLFCFSDAILCGIAGQNPNEDMISPGLVGWVGMTIPLSFV